MFFGLIFLVQALVIKALVLHGFPTTTTLHEDLALSLMAYPTPLKIYPFPFNKSDLSIPGPLGLAPTNMATSAPLKPLDKSVLTSIECKVGKAQSEISMAIPLHVFSQLG